MKSKRHVMQSEQDGIYWQHVCRTPEAPSLDCLRLDQSQSLDKGIWQHRAVGGCVQQGREIAQHSTTGRVTEDDFDEGGRRVQLRHKTKPNHGTLGQERSRTTPERYIGSGSSLTRPT